jgi:hypothetical protein
LELVVGSIEQDTQLFLSDQILIGGGFIGKHRRFPSAAGTENPHILGLFFFQKRNFILSILNFN